jgi:pimeloyl-ACP methyl ester carboxylesterase
MLGGFLMKYCSSKGLILLFTVLFFPPIFCSQLAQATSALSSVTSSLGIPAPLTEDKQVTRFQSFTIEEFPFINREGTRLYGTVFIPNVRTDNGRFPMITIAYGTACINRMYGLLFRELAKRGYIVSAVDYRGQGFSEGVLPVAPNGKIDGDAFGNDIIDFQEYVIKNYPVDQESLGIWGWSLGTVVTPVVLSRPEGRNYKAISQMGILRTDLTEKVANVQYDYEDVSSAPLQIQSCIGALHDEDFIAPWWWSPVEAYEVYKGPKMIILHGPSYGMAGMTTKERVYDYAYDVADFFDAFLKEDPDAYARLLQPDPFCNQIGRTFDFGEDKREFTEDERAMIEEARRTRGAKVSTNIFLPMWRGVVAPMLALVNEPLEVGIKSIVPWDRLWVGFMDYWEYNTEPMP